MMEENLISGNARSGIFAARGYYVGVIENRIGVASNGEPLGNGNSGVFLNVGGAFNGGPPLGADVEGNIIANHPEFGVARTRLGEISVIENSIFNNGHGAIDVDLNLATPNRDDDTSGIPNKPVLFWALYDASTDRTSIRGMLDSTPGSTGALRIDFYTSQGLSRVSSQPEAQTLVTHYDVTPGATHADFEVSIPGNHHGEWITATNNRWHIVGFSRPPDVMSSRRSGLAGHLISIPSDTSELSNAVLVR